MTKKKAKQIDFTGERILPGKTANLFFQEHACRYKLTRDYIQGKIVLDTGCGEGYGAYYLAHYAQRAIGVDISEEVIEYAKRKYTKNNLQFAAMDCYNLGLNSEIFDVICSFEVMEHLPDAEKYLREMLRVLKPNGLFIVSTPNIDNYPLKGLNEFHIKEYSFSEFREILEKHFSTVDYLGEKCTAYFKKYYYYLLAKIFLKSNMLTRIQNFIGSLLEGDNSRIVSLDDLDTKNFYFSKNDISKSDYFIALCVKEKSPDSLLSNRESVPRSR